MASLLSFCTSCLKTKDVEFIEARNLQFGKLSEGKIPLKVITVFNNPNNIRAEIREMQLEIQWDNAIIGKASQKFFINVPARDTFEVPVLVDLSADAVKEKLKNDFLNILTEGHVSIPITIKGKCTAHKFGFDFDIPINMQKSFDVTLDDLLSKIKF